ncbi:trypsin beta-like [Phlebotomus papatasi]|uniref:trypsin beta-like n=1 Tax=Phlebotomus papatasi TaxID=29031 RepID=UPI002483A046|nr:trypsin beta-like [Phlebotomus papatasi]
MKLIILLTLVFASADAYPKFYRDIDGFIVGGQEANIEDFPYMLSLRAYSQHICGASVIADRWALTAAHCVQYASSDEISFLGGTAYLYDGGDTFQADEIYIHPEYYIPSDYNNDVAVVHVTSSFIVNGIQAVALAVSGGDMDNGDRALIKGWGATSYQGPSTTELRWAEVNVISREICDFAYGSITDSMLCAAYPGRDACQGDSGGPLTTMDHVQHGIVSFGYGCADSLFPGVYARVGAPIIRDWINNVTGV